MEDRVIELKDKKIKFDIKHFGEQGEDGWSLFISLHGGGGTTESENNRLWNRHKTLYELKNGILFSLKHPLTYEQERLISGKFSRSISIPYSNIFTL